MARAGRILLVDDDREMVQGLGIRLRSAGFEVLTAFDGEEGLASAIAHRPDAVVLDARLPRMDGLTVLRRLRERQDLGFIPVVMLSASLADRWKALEMGARHFVEKPYDPRKLVAAVQSAVAHRLPARTEI